MIVNRLGITGDVPAERSGPADESAPRERWLTLAVQTVPLTGLETGGASLHTVALAAGQRRIVQRARLAPEEIRAVADEDLTADCRSDDERILLRFASMFAGDHGVGDAVIEQLRTNYDDVQTIGLCPVCAHGGALACTWVAPRIEQLEGTNR